jgi:hypothetical protein
VQSSCEQELNRVLEEISRMTLQENLYELRFPNCDRNGLYNLKQVHTFIPSPIASLTLSLSY